MRTFNRKILYLRTTFVKYHYVPGNRQGDIFLHVYCIFYSTILRLYVYENANDRKTRYDDNILSGCFLFSKNKFYVGMFEKSKN